MIFTYSIIITFCLNVSKKDRNWINLVQAFFFLVINVKFYSLLFFIHFMQNSLVDIMLWRILYSSYISFPFKSLHTAFS